ILNRLIKQATGKGVNSPAVLHDVLETMRNNPTGSRVAVCRTLFIWDGTDLYCIPELLGPGDHNKTRPVAITPNVPLRWSNFLVTYKRTSNHLPDMPLFVRKLNIKDWQRVTHNDPHLKFKYKSVPVDIKFSVPCLVTEEGELLAVPHFRYNSFGIGCEVQFSPAADVYSNLDYIHSASPPAR
ncbi:hypothetical protein PROFUN_04058, partial [Planoprotostelium fungivorum]